LPRAPAIVATRTGPSNMLSRLPTLIDRLFPTDLGIAGVQEEFRAYTIEFTAPQLRISLWLAVVTDAAFGFWDIFGQDGGVQMIRFRYLVTVPIFILFAVLANYQIARVYREAFVLLYAAVSTVLVFANVIIIDSEMPFKIDNGNATLNFYLICFSAMPCCPTFWQMDWWLQSIRCRATIRSLSD
jgi:hypothetical protein